LGKVFNPCKTFVNGAIRGCIIGYESKTLTFYYHTNSSFFW
jgi:hypothetical protein